MKDSSSLFVFTVKKTDTDHGGRVMIFCVLLDCVPVCTLVPLCDAKIHNQMNEGDLLFFMNEGDLLFFSHNAIFIA